MVLLRTCGCSVRAPSVSPPDRDPTDPRESPWCPAAAGTRRRRWSRRCERSVTEREIGQRDPADSDREPDRSAHGWSYGCEERLSGARSFPTCTESSGPHPGPVTAILGAQAAARTTRRG